MHIDVIVNPVDFLFSFNSYMYVLKNQSTWKQKRYLPHFTDRHIKSLHEIRPYLKFKCCMMYVYEDNLFRFINHRQNIGSNKFVQGLPALSYTAYTCHPTVCLHRSYQYLRFTDSAFNCLHNFALSILFS